jgi:hypothetical protein
MLKEFECGTLAREVWFCAAAEAIAARTWSLESHGKLTCNSPSYGFGPCTYYDTSTCMHLFYTTARHVGLVGDPLLSCALRSRAQEAKLNAKQTVSVTPSSSTISRNQTGYGFDF